VTPHAALQRIYNFRWCAPDLASAGQPLHEEFALLRDAGFEVVIDLALLDAEYSVPDEAQLVRQLGMEFLHIPVLWESPTVENFQDFRHAMRRCQGRKVFVHCAANMRVSVFLALYRILDLGWRPEQAWPEVEAIWQPNPQWQRFIAQILPLSS